MASTACSEVCLALHLRVKLPSASRALAALCTKVNLNSPASKNQLGYFVFSLFRVGCVEFQPDTIP